MLLYLHRISNIGRLLPHGLSNLFHLTSLYLYYSSKLARSFPHGLSNISQHTSLSIPIMILILKQQSAILRISHYYSNLLAISPSRCYYNTHEIHYLIIYHVLSIQYNPIPAQSISTIVSITSHLNDVLCYQIYH